MHAQEGLQKGLWVGCGWLSRVMKRRSGLVEILPDSGVFKNAGVAFRGGHRGNGAAWERINL